MDREFPSPATRALVRQAEEVEAVGFRPRPARAREGFTPERHETRLFRMESEPVSCEPLGEYVQDLFRILTILKAQHRVISVADYKHLATEARLHLALNPFVEHKVKYTLARSGLMVCPCPVPVSLSSKRPSSMTPMLIHFRISLRMLASLIRLSIISMSCSLTIESN
jgi:hypothetical protein